MNLDIAGCRMSDLLEGVMLSDFLLLKCVSRGGVADVYRGRQVGDGNYEVAVKSFRPGYAQRESFREYFMAEAEKIGQFEHPNILPFLEFGEGEGLLYAVTPFVATGTLADLLNRVGGKFSAMQALPIMQQLCSAVQYAHDRDVIHGNIKPSNVFVAGDGRMLLSDFGIVRGYDDSQQSLTRIGWGSAEYAAPEHSLGVLRRASDIYALGVLLFRLLTGHPPFSGQTPVEVLLKHVRQAPPSARSFDPNISDAVDGVLQMALRKRADDRFASAEEFSHALLTAVTVAPIASPVAKAAPLATTNLREGVERVPSPGTPVANAYSQSYQPGGPYTPLPTNVAHTPSPSRMPPPAEQFVPPGPVSSPLQQVPPLAGPVAGTGGEARKEGFLQEDDDVGTHLFWSVDPVEWSPLGVEQAGAVPLTAGEYLRSKPMAQAVPPESAAASTATVPAEPEAEKKSRGKVSEIVRAHKKKLLPVLVVVLLLLGLLAALLSSFLFPGPSLNSGAIPFQIIPAAALKSHLPGPTI